MADEGFKRKLTAILSADVVGYSRLMEDNEEATIQTLNTYRNSISTLIQQHRGRVVDMTGDNLMAEFSSVVDAVKCAVETQKEMSERNADLPENRRMLFRIGVNLGDIIEEEDRIYGDGVNIAARLEGLAEAGGICISRTAYDQVKNKLELGYEYLGEHSVKNISEPVHVYRVLMEPEAAGKVIGEKRKEKRRMTLAAVIVLLIGAGGLAGWYLYIEQTKRIEPASMEKMAYPLPDKPSIAVLPFDNMSEDPKQDYFSDGITEEIITALSKVPKLFVIARNSTFTYKGKPVKVKQVAEELGVRYVLEGSIRKAGDKIRITAQLIDALTGHHLWAERYDRNLKDIFAVQDEITKNIITAMQVKLTRGEQARTAAKGTNNLEAYLKLLQAREKMSKGNKENNALAQRLLEETIALDPDYASAYALLGAIQMMDVWLGSSKSPKDSIKKAIELSKKALALDESLADARSLLGFLYAMTQQPDKGVAEAERAVELDPNSANAHHFLCLTLRFAERPDEAIPVCKKAIRLEPYALAAYYYNLGMAYLLAGQCEEAISACEEALRRGSNNVFAHVNATVAYIMCGREEEARATAAEVLRISPKFSVEKFAKNIPFKNQAAKEEFVDTLRNAGLK
jgi:adenylate cyclase